MQQTLKELLKKKRWFVTGAAFLIVAMLLLITGVFTSTPPQMVTTTVDSGPVRQLVSVSGVAKAKEKADLSFPQTGVVSSVLVEVGDVVAAGDILAVLRSQSEESDRLAAMASLRSAIASRGELIAGPTASTRKVVNETVQLKKESLVTTIDIETSKAAAAKRTLLSEGLSAYTNKADEDARPPVVSGTYTCDTEGTYTIEMYPSNSISGYSFKLSGIESGTYTASVDQATAFGSCGLRLKFDPESSYANSHWIIEVPNTKSPTYTLNKNAYELAVIQAGSAIDLARQEVALAEADAFEATASPRSEALEKADAAVAEAQASVQKFDSELSDRILRAPFSGTITAVDIKAGETSGNLPAIKIISDGAFEIIAKVPEIDVGKLNKGQPVELLFDAKNDQVLEGEISFISLEATEIDGVAYFNTYITLTETPTWMRSGLNADIDIIVAKTTEGVRIPKRFLIEADGAYSVLRRTDETTFSTTTIQVLLRGNDGFVAVTGVNANDILVAP